MVRLNSELARLIQQHEGQVHIHLGSGARFPGSSGGRKLGKNELHICIDLNHPDPKETPLAEIIEKTGKIGKHDVIRFSGNTVVFIKADMQKTPLPNACADWVHLENSLANHEMQRPGKIKVFFELKRLLKSNGTAQNVELYVPDGGTYDDTLNAAKRAGLNTTVVVQPLKQNASARDANVFHTYLNQYRPRDPNLIFRGAYILQFRKT